MDFVWYLVLKSDNFESQLADRRKLGFRPYVIAPILHDDPTRSLIILCVTNNSKNWEVGRFTTIGELNDFAIQSKKQKRFVYQIRAYKDAKGRERFDAIAWENPKGYDWDFKFDMSTREYEDELVRRKAEGFRPTTVTSYGDPADPKYAAAWIRYFDLPKK